jgi:hypothetical protein
LRCGHRLFEARRRRSLREDSDEARAALADGIGSDDRNAPVPASRVFVRSDLDLARPSTAAAVLAPSFTGRYPTSRSQRRVPTRQS